MSANNPTARARQITMDELSDFLIERNVSQQCPSCGHDSAGINVNAGTEDASIAKWDVASIDGHTARISSVPGKYILAVSISCENCFYARFFILAKILEWLEERDKEQSKEK